VGAGRGFLTQAFQPLLVLSCPGTCTVAPVVAKQKASADNARIDLIFIIWFYLSVWQLTAARGAGSV
jgi:hypothetical protein